MKHLSSRNSARIARIVVGFLLAFLVSAPSNAQQFGRNKVHYDSFDFSRFETDHFTIYFYPEEELLVKDAARMAERWYERHKYVFMRQFGEKKPIIFYANDADFQQTNVISGQIGQGTGGVTESLKQRVSMPFTGIYAENDHVLGHELVHSFQYDLVFESRSESANYEIDQIPLWFVEGMAEYLSIGRDDPHTAMWLRDAALRDDLPSINQLTRRPDLYFPYRYGHAYLAYIGGKYGDGAIASLFEKAGLLGLEAAFEYTFGITPDSLSREWQDAVKRAYLPLAEGRSPVAAVGRRLLAKDLDAGKINLAPALSPDGRYIAFLSERDLFSIDLFIADVETGKIIKKLKKGTNDRHIDALRFIGASGSWSPDGRQFAFVTFAKGDNEIAFWNLDSGKIERRIHIDEVSALMNLAWSPDGRLLAVAGLDGGASDLYLLDLEQNTVRQLTNDRYADLQPAWSPDGKTLAFITDRGKDGSNFETLAYAKMRLGLVDVETGQIEAITPLGNDQHFNPQFAPDGQNLYFISDHKGFKDIYRTDLQTQEVFQVTRAQTGISGITSLSPALSVASQNGRLAFSVFSDNSYTVNTLEHEDAVGTLIEERGAEDREDIADVPAASILPPFLSPQDGIVGSRLSDAKFGLPDPPSEIEDYSPKIRLDYIAPPTMGVSVGGYYGTGIAGSLGMYFSDMLGNHNLAVSVLANGTYKDVGGQVSYLNQKRRLNFGAFAAHIPYLYGSIFIDSVYDIDTWSEIYRYNEIYRRIFIDQLGFASSYPISMRHRLEMSVSGVRYGFDYEVRSYLISGSNVENEIDLQEPDPLYLSQLSLAYVEDFSYFGLTSPLKGGRYRLQVSPSVGTENFISVLVDFRRYFRLKPVTFAFRGLHIGNYGASEDELFAAEYLGDPYYPGFIRGYSYYSFDYDECSTDACPELDRLRGTRLALASAELRIPLLGTPTLGLISFPYLPTDVSLFVDAGISWTEEESPVWQWSRRSDTRTPIVSAGVSTRMNFFNAFVLEIYYAHPYQRPEKGGHLGFLIMPGW